MKTSVLSGLLLAIFMVLYLPWRGVPFPPSAGRVKNRLDSVLKQLPEKLAADPSGKSAQVFLNEQRLIIDVIQPYFYAIHGALHETSPAREERVRQVEEWLDSFEPVLETVARASFRLNDCPNAVMQLFCFTKPTPRAREALLAMARDPHTNYQKAGEAYDALFMLQLDDEAVRLEVRRLIDRRDDFHTRADLAQMLLQSASSRWAMLELEELYRDFLSIPFQKENYPARGGREKLRIHYDVAVRGLKAFGVLGAPFIGLLRARVAEMDPAQDADLINSANETLMMLEGRCNPRPVVSWKGQWLGISKKAWEDWVASHPSK